MFIGIYFYKEANNHGICFKKFYWLGILFYIFIYFFFVKNQYLINITSLTDKKKSTLYIMKLHNNNNHYSIGKVIATLNGK